ncbi:MAG: bifunctional glycosyltransferase family 2/GtrA family protein [Galactobacillus timonensis]|uniref:bifunctional glycosyltransferase family 2/GtrA family protein n=2 Tax=Galactobacillus timonensis TaxID=2041840 RepID=UPI002409BE46|nr:bifunctional glycosyltransferase family 2/GtrA family protein [Galactobacillus timonensis]MDD6599663.1 bifunctional glycosyltransferase family 2/GtrA family protein [Galactobacillus timonensis]
MTNHIPVIIPAYEPDDNLLNTIQKLLAADQSQNLIIINDGSGPDYDVIFSQAETLLSPQGRGVVLRHAKNMGKGRALKTGFSFALKEDPELIGCVTADSDGQHTPEDIAKVAEALRMNPDSLVLGVRDFSSADIPWKSSFGNKLTMKVLQYVSGLKLQDTQTGLRGIPSAFMKELLNVPGERFEFETRMLLESVDRYSIIEVPIQTIYESKENHQTHFRPFKDSLIIYSILGARFFRYIFASLSSSVIDLILFSVFCAFLKQRVIGYAAVATILARIISATCNYLMNYRFVFQSHAGVISSGKYALLAVVQMSLSALLVTAGISVFSSSPEVVIKIIVDTLLFFLSYFIQRKFVF